MATVLKPGWKRPFTILFASEIPANEKAFSFALAQAVEFGAELILFHAYDKLVVPATESSSVFYYDSTASSRDAMKHMEPLAERVREAGVKCKTVVRPGPAAVQILCFLRERKIDRIVMGTHSPGPIGKLLVGSVAEAVLRMASVPVFIVGPEVVDCAYDNSSLRTILCGLSLHESSSMVASFAAELAAEHNARLVLQHVIRPQERFEVLAGRSIDQIEDEMVSLIPVAFRGRIAVQPIVTSGEPTEELLFQARTQQAGLIVLGAQGASVFAAVAHLGVVYMMLAHARCPVMTLSPVVLAASSAKIARIHSPEVFLAGVF
jgi:nucleotide-binding universal stress UspA family protein